MLNIDPTNLEDAVKKGSQFATPMDLTPSLPEPSDEPEATETSDSDSE